MVLSYETISFKVKKFSDETGSGDKIWCNNNQGMINSGWVSHLV